MPVKLGIGQYVVHIMGMSEVHGYFNEYKRALGLFKANRNERVALFYCSAQGILLLYRTVDYPFNKLFV